MVIPVGIDVSKDRLAVLLLDGEQRAGQPFTKRPTSYAKLDSGLRRRLKPNAMPV